MDQHPSQPIGPGAASSSSSRSSDPTQIQSLQQQHEDLQRQVDAARRARSVLAATAHAIQHMNGVIQSAKGDEEMEWSLVDVNLVLIDGRRFHTALAATLHLRADRASRYQIPELTSGLQTIILNKLNEYAPAAASLQPEQPRDADELLQWLAIELACSCNCWLESFIQLLINMLHHRGFDLNRRSCDGRTLLTAYASAGQNQQTIDLECMLMRLGADASTAASDGRTPIFIWIAKQDYKVIESLLVDNKKMPYPGLNQHVDLWQRDADGRTPLECLLAKGAVFAPCATVLTELQRHWILHERPLVQSLLTLHTPLIPDLARLTVDYIDGGEEAQ